MSVTRMTDQVGRVLGGRYRLVAPLGTGTSAQVYLAEDVKLRRRVAVKVLHQALADDEVFLRRFRTEAQTAASLNHPHILAVLDWGEDEEPYLVTEYLGGGTLRDLLDSGARLTSSQALLVGLETARGLDYAHRRGLVHRDIKPANLVFDTEGRLRIADFGLARALAEASHTEPTGSVLGTARYATPEQARGEVVTPKSDVYALALVLVESVTGHVPFEADTTIGTLMARTERPIEAGPELEGLARPVDRAGRIDPDDRPDADEFAVLLMASAESMARPEPLPLAATAVERAAPSIDPDPTMVPNGEDATELAPVAVPPAPPTRRQLRRERVIEQDRERAERQAAIASGAVRPRRWPWILLTLLLLAGAAVGGWLLYQSGQSDTYSVPNLVNSDIDDLPDEVAEAGWSVERNDVRRENTVAGQIVAQSPVAGSVLEEGGELALSVSLGPPLVAVPQDLVGLSVQDAEFRLRNIGLDVGATREAFDEEVPLGVIVEMQEFRPEVEQGALIDLVVSAGPEPRVVPDGLEGRTFVSVEAELAELRLTTIRIDEFDDEIAEGLIIAIDPAAGTRVPADSSITIVVSKGPELVAVPNVFGLDVLEASEVLEEAGFVIGETNGPANTEVVATVPPQDELAPIGSEVELITAQPDDTGDEGDDEDD